MSSRELKPEEVRDIFLDHVWAYIDFWANETRVESERDRLSGLAHSILALIDGSAAFVPGFILAPNPHQDDKSFNQENGENWYPENHELEDEIKADIAGSLHELLYRAPRAQKR